VFPREAGDVGGRTSAVADRPAPARAAVAAGVALTPGLFEPSGAVAPPLSDSVSPGRTHCVAASPFITRVASSEGEGGGAIVPAIIASNSAMVWGRSCSSRRRAAPIAAANVGETLPFAAMAIGTSGSFLTSAAADGGLVPVRHL
jgi:hypothetical protein